MRALARVECYLGDVTNRGELNERIEEQLRDILERQKARAVERGNQELAKLIWCFGQILNIQNKYITSFHDMKRGSYYSAWSLLERIEIALASLGSHFEPEDDEYKLQFIDKHVKQFQSLFPYKLFLSPSMLVKEKVCSICRNRVSIRTPCGHKVGEIYNGEMCYRIITEAEVLEISIVDTPGHKYAVPFVSDSDSSAEFRDHYNYAALGYVVDGLRNPFDAWSISCPKRRHPHCRYEYIAQDEDCPCESGEKYKDCCLAESGVLRPHLEIVFSVPPPRSQLEIMYID